MAKPALKTFVCKNQRCRRWPYEIAVDHEFQCDHDECPGLSLIPEPPAAAAKELPGKAWLIAIAGTSILAVVIAISSFFSNDSTPSPPTPHPPPISGNDDQGAAGPGTGSRDPSGPGSAPEPKPDYEREVFELISFIRGIMESTDKINTVQSTLDNSLTLTTDQAGRYQNLLETNRRRLEEYLDLYTQKLDFLKAHDQDAIDGFLDQIQPYQDSDGERYRKAIMLAKSHWGSTKSGTRPSRNKIVADCDRLWPL